jgi:hypothetical protein
LCASRGVCAAAVFALFGGCAILFFAISDPRYRFRQLLLGWAFSAAIGFTGERRYDFTKGSFLTDVADRQQLERMSSISMEK